MENQEMINTGRYQSPVTVGDWVVTLIILAIPLVNLIMLIVWAFSSSTPKSKSNFAKASLIMMLIGLVLMLIFWSSLIALIGSSMRF